ncbi:MULTISPECIES: hypothetical protein [unclassified Streptosporangium]|uniref:hypothetical protein n=1 Tax=unclassified Streptosporangium TaxID=2632669 RepID=UPI002E2C8BFB|nr:MULTISPECIES: hypothetical protein [unclassified Streptosporangium]
MRPRRIIAVPALAAVGLLLGTSPVFADPGSPVAPPAPTRVSVPSVNAPSTDSSTALADPCWNRENRWWCSNRTSAPIYEAGTSNIVDYLRTNPSVFVCRAEGARNNNGPHPNRWEWTNGDVTGRWGYVMDSWISSETDPLPVC